MCGSLNLNGYFLLLFGTDLSLSKLLSLRITCCCHALQDGSQAALGASETMSMSRLQSGERQQRVGSRRLAGQFMHGGHATPSAEELPMAITAEHTLVRGSFHVLHPPFEAKGFSMSGFVSDSTKEI
jgi:hypothetical protein